MIFLPIWENKIKFNNHKNLPHSLRCLIVGSNGCGKTCLLLKMLFTPNLFDFDNLIIFTKSSFQPEYQLLVRSITFEFPISSDLFGD